MRHLVNTEGGGTTRGRVDIVARSNEKQFKEMKERSYKAVRKVRDMQLYCKELEQKNEAAIHRLVEENRRKSMEVDKLNLRLREVLDTCRELKKRTTVEVAKAVAATRKEEDQKQIEIRKANLKLQKEMQEINNFKEQRRNLLEELKTAKVDYQLLKTRHVEETRTLERKFVMARESMQKDMDKKIKLIKTECKSLVMKEIEIELKKLRMLNTQMSDEIRFHVAGNKKLRDQNEKLRTRNKQYKLELELASQKDNMQSTRGAKRSDIIRKLRDEKEELEIKNAALKQNILNLKRELKAKSGPTDDKFRIDQLQMHLRKKTDEVLRIKSLAKRILEQRGDVERFFLGALEQVKREIREKRQREAKMQKKSHTRQLLNLARGGKMKDNRKKSSAASEPKINQKVDISDLSAEDRERVLRLLFSKINSAAQAANPPMAVGFHKGDEDEDEEKVGGDNTFLTNYDDENDEDDAADDALAAQAMAAAEAAKSAAEELLGEKFAESPTVGLAGAFET